MRLLRRYAFRLIGLAILGWFSGLLAPAYAQVDEETFQQLEFNFIPPGARATAMGGAFIGLADDATAAQTNPAGLLVLLRPEVAFEAKFLNYDIPRLASRDSLFTFEPTTFGANVGSPAFVSFVFPGKNRRWAVALFRHEFIRLKDEFTFDPRETIVPGLLFFPVEGRMEFKGEQYGLALAVRLGALDVGVSGKLARMKVQSFIRRDFCEPIEFDLCGDPFVANVEALDDTDTGFGFTVGLMWRPSSKFQVGLVGEINPTFQWKDDTLSAELPDGGLIPLDTIEPRLGIPHRFGGGFAFRPTDQFVLTADVVWLQYSRILPQDVQLLYAYDSPRASAPENFYVRDRVEVHGGGEYVFFVGSTTVALRAGAFVFPERRIHYTRPGGTLSPVDAFWADTFERLYNGLEDKTRVGVAGGVGFVFQNRLQVDVAYSWSKPVKQFSGSAVLRF
jgi:hypothetical protein